MSFSSQTQVVSDSSGILDYKIISTKYAHESKHYTDFKDKINHLLSKGYSLHGPTTLTGGDLLQVLVKKTKLLDPIIENYAIIGSNISIYSGDSQLKISMLERDILDALRDDWSLYGNLNYSSHGNSFMYIQPLVKYKKQEVNLLDF
jgi:hypothetical protein